MGYKSIGKYINVLHKSMSYYINKRLDDYNINKDQIEILHHLYNNEGLSQNELGKNLMVDKITITKRLKGLVKEGYVEKRISKKDRRIKELYITEKGYMVKKTLRDILNETTDILLGDIPESKEKIIKEILAKMSENIYSVVKEMKNTKYHD